MIEPIKQLRKRIDSDKCESETGTFYTLLYYGEAVFKMIVLAFVASIKDDPNRSRYSIEYSIVRSSGIGDWYGFLLKVRDLNSIMNDMAREDFIALTNKSASNEWQHDAVTLLRGCLSVVLDNPTPLPANKENLLSWFDLFAQFRNKTRAHGALPIDKIENIVVPLEESINLIVENLDIFKREWAYLKRTIQKKYRVTRISENIENFSDLKTIKAIGMREEYTEGIYIYWGKPVCISLLKPVDQSVSDFYLPNGGWNNKKYELLCYTTGSTKATDAEPYLKPAADLPISETQARGDLDVIGNVFTNMPTKRKDYIQRPILEEELMSTLLKEDTRPIVTLVGRGGIGKTWLSLTVLHNICMHQRFQSILWFSARDVDLTESGYSLVKPHLLSIDDIATEYSRLVDNESKAKSPKSDEKIRRLAQDFASPNLLIGPTLFVFDNFETLEDPVSIYSWIEQHIRNPNKVIITTRNRNFKADYPIHVQGLEFDEYTELVSNISNRLGCVLNSDIIEKIYSRSEGHPYIVRLVLSEIASSKRKNPDMILLERMDVLEFLFERTYQLLSAEAQRLFLTLSDWDSCVSLTALSAVMICSVDFPIDASQAAEELINTSFIEIIENQKDNTTYVSVPLAAMLFGKKKILTSDYLIDIKLDSKMLQRFGAVLETGTDCGFKSSFRRFLNSYMDQFSENRFFETRTLSVINSILDEKNELRLEICRFYAEAGEKPSDYSDLIQDELKLFIQNCKSISRISDSWKWILDIQKEEGNCKEMLKTIAAIANNDGINYDLLSECANLINSLRNRIGIEDTRLLDFAREKVIEVMIKRQNEGNATDFSRIAWLLNNNGKHDDAKTYAQKGLTIDKNNLFCLRFLDGCFR